MTPADILAIFHRVQEVQVKRVAAKRPTVDRSLSLTDQVYIQLKEDILRAEWKPDSVLVEPELASLYGVSKTPVREALRLLVRDGLVIVMPRKGYLVRSISLSDTREIFGLRAMVEPQLAADAAKSQNRVGVSLLAELLERQRNASELDVSLAAARQFHLQLATLGNNTRAEQILHGLLDEMRRLHHLMPDVEGHIWSDEEINAHTAVLEAVRAGDSSLARDLMERHLDEVHRTMMLSLSAVRNR